MKALREHSPGRMIRRLRERRDLLQKTVALRAGLDPSRLAKFERGETRPPPPGTVERILDVLDADAAERSLILSTVVVDRIAWDALQRYDADRTPDAQKLLRGCLRLSTAQMVAVISLVESMLPSH